MENASGRNWSKASVTEEEAISSQGSTVDSKETMMRIFIAGASGAVGQPLVRRLAEAGHEVHGMTRTPGKAARLRELGAEPVVADALDREAVLAAVRVAGPDVVVHQLTAIANANLRNLDAAFVLTNRLRTE